MLVGLSLGEGREFGNRTGPGMTRQGLGVEVAPTVPTHSVRVMLTGRTGVIHWV